MDSFELLGVVWVKCCRVNCWGLSISIVLSWKLVLTFFVMKNIIRLLSLGHSSVGWALLE